MSISFFVMRAIEGMGQPSTIVRLMAFRDSRTLRYSMLYLTVYNMIVYIPLIFIFVCSRSILPNLAKSDEVMPRLVIYAREPLSRGPYSRGAPYGAVLSTVSGFLLIISSGLSGDAYQPLYPPNRV